MANNNKEINDEIMKSLRVKKNKTGGITSPSISANKVRSMIFNMIILELERFRNSSFIKCDVGYI